jgi:hypothetical protein
VFDAPPFSKTQKARFTMESVSRIEDMTNTTRTASRNGANHKLDPRSPTFTRDFKRAAKAFTKKATQSPETALAVLIEAGIYTRTGRLTKNYR